MRILMFGGSGMLGKCVMEEATRAGHLVHAPAHDDCDITLYSDVADAVGMAKPDVMINCAGLRVGSEPELILANAFGPHVLAGAGVPLLHVSTDCVFSGRYSGPHPGPIEAARLPDPDSVYGRSKLLGESAQPHVLNVRTSFVGPEHGFLRWLLDATGTVEAWMHAYWNGGSVWQVARELVRLAESGRRGIIHLAAPEPVSKAWMIEYLADALNLKVSIQMMPEPRIWRGLLPDVDLPSVKDALDEVIEKVRSELA